MFSMTGKHRRFDCCSLGMPMRLPNCAKCDVNDIRNCDVIQLRVFRQAGPMPSETVQIGNFQQVLLDIRPDLPRAQITS